MIAFAGLVLFCVLISFAVFFEQAGAMNLFARAVILATGIGAAFLAGMEYRKHRIVWALSISGIAEIRVSRPSQATTPASSDTGTPPDEIRYLSAGSLITPILLVLRLADSHDNINTLMIFPDSVSQDAFRRVSLACRWLSAQRHRRTQNVF